MKVGDLVRHWLTEQIGVVIAISRQRVGHLAAVQVVWTTQGESLFGPGTKEWCNKQSVEPLASRSAW